MTAHDIRRILGTRAFTSDGGLHTDPDMDKYYVWYTGDPTAMLEGNFTADELEAIAAWMRRKEAQ